jgi:hypothetical protein
MMASIRIVADPQPAVEAADVIGRDSTPLRAHSQQQQACAEQHKRRGFRYGSRSAAANGKVVNGEAGSCQCDDLEPADIRRRP